MCNSVLENVEYYEHPKTAQWNETIIVCLTAGAGARAAYATLKLVHELC